MGQGGPGATKLTEAIARNTCLTALYLDYNCIGVQDALEIAEMLLVNSTLSHLYLSGRQRTRLRSYSDPSGACYARARRGAPDDSARILTVPDSIVK
jgi:hypothetical protein